jgi:hypothetical protein
MKRTHIFTVLITIIILLFLRFMIEFFKSHKLHNIIEFKDAIHSLLLTPDGEAFPVTVTGNEPSFLCDDPNYISNIWCQVKMPTKSFFRFSNPPNNVKRWKLAQQNAILKKHILLEKIINSFTNDQDFLDGDTMFRSYHRYSDYFLDESYNFDILDFDNQTNFRKTLEERSKIFESNVMKMEKVSSPWKPSFKWNKDLQVRRKNVLGPIKPLYSLQRAPILHIGYMFFAGHTPFTGNQQGEIIIDRHKMLSLWEKSFKNKKIKFPWVGLHSANENWGLFSTFFPNRTTNWGSCCSKEFQSSSKDLLVPQFLDDPHTLLFFTNQHHNLTHPKLLTLPRGIPIMNPGVDKMLYETMHQLLSFNNESNGNNSNNSNTHSKKDTQQLNLASTITNLYAKDNLLFTSSSNWGYRPKIIDCIHQKFLQEPAVKWNKYDSKLKGRLTPKEYYIQLGKSLFSLALPGLGYDTFR